MCGRMDNFADVHWLIITPMIVEFTRWVLISGCIYSKVGIEHVRHVPGGVVFDVVPWTTSPLEQIVF